MGFFARVLLVVVTLGGAVIYQNYRELSKPLPVPKLDTKFYWGPGKSSQYKEDTKITPFKISYTNDGILNELNSQLSRPPIFHEALEGTNFEYGFNSKKLEKVIKYWRDEYLPRWSERETYLNRFPQFKTQIQGLQIHFIHQKPKLTKEQLQTKKVIPLLLIHGWPGSVREFYELIPKLTTPCDKTDFVFEVVVPSLPGYGWSQAASKPGLGTAGMAVILKNLMTRLGYERFLVQGGDWGSVIGSNIATLFPENTIGYHSNMCVSTSPMAMIKLTIAAQYPSWFVEKGTEDFFFPAAEKLAYLVEETGYMHIQSTKPDTIGTVLSSNPVGLAAYILEKFSTWTNPSFRSLSDGGLEKKFPLDSLIDNLMIYYLTNSITTSQRIYAEQFSSRERGLQLDRVPSNAPFGCARFKNDMYHSFDWQLNDKHTNFIHSTFYQDGGHFAAFEVPNVLYKDFIDFVTKIKM